MLAEHLNDNGYQYLVTKFKEDKIASRFDFVKDSLEAFIIENGLEENVKLSIRNLMHIITDYFVDIDRLKEFQDIECTNETKIYAYLSFWILRHKPLQVVNDEHSEYDLTFINEEFVTTFLCSFLFNKPSDVVFVEEKRADIEEFVKTLKYYLSYRDFTAKSIELVLLAFSAGRGYQYSVNYQK